MEVDVSLAGNSFSVRLGNQVKRRRPDWMSIVLDGNPDDDPDVNVMGYAYWPGGPHSGNDPILYQANEVAHYAPIPDPLAQYRGMSWLTPVIREIMADKGFVEHKINFLEHGGTHNFLFQIDKNTMSEEQFNAFISSYRAQHEGADSAYKSIFLRAAIDATPLGSNMQQTDFKNGDGSRGDTDSGSGRSTADRGRVLRGLGGGYVFQLRAGPPTLRRRHRAPPVAERSRLLAEHHQDAARVATLVRRPRHPGATGGLEGARGGAGAGGDLDSNADRRRLRSAERDGRGICRRLEATEARRVALGAVAGAGSATFYERGELRSGRSRTRRVMDRPHENLIRAETGHLSVRAAENGGMPTLTGRFAAPGDWTEIRSVVEGHFMERFSASAFEKTIKERTKNMRVLFHHGQDPFFGTSVAGADPLAGNEHGL